MSYYLFSIFSSNTYSPVSDFSPICSVLTFKCSFIHPLSLDARCSSDDDVAISARDPFSTLIHTKTDLLQNTSEREIIPWLCQQANSISASCLESSVSTKKPSSTTTPLNLPNAKWFYHGELPLGTDSKNVQKMYLELSWKEYLNTKCSNDRVHWEDVEIVGEHTDRQHFVTKKSIKLAEYA